MSGYGGLIPINVITGFLGSGKTTLLQRLLAVPELGDTAVLINEFGEIGLDHQLVDHVDETTLLLDNGCLCCAVRGDLQDALKDLLSRRQRGSVPAFRRIVIETSGLADPVPIAYTLLTDPVLQHHLRLGNIVTTVDAVNAESQLGRFAESRKQVAVADRLVVTKAGLLPEDGDLSALEAALRGYNRAAPILVADQAQALIERLLTDDLYDAAGKARTVEHWLAGEGEDGDRQAVSAIEHAHADDVASFALTFDEALDWSAFGIWLSMLLHRHGERVLRVKGLLHVAGLATPVLINGVQHIVHPPGHLAAWPDADRRSRLIFIVQGMAREPIEASFLRFLRLSNPPGVGRRVA